MAAGGAKPHGGGGTGDGEASGGAGTVLLTSSTLSAPPDGSSHGPLMGGTGRSQADHELAIGNEVEPSEES
jgi:hypothetical protein